MELKWRAWNTPGLCRLPHNHLARALRQHVIDDVDCSRHVLLQLLCELRLCRFQLAASRDVLGIEARKVIIDRHHHHHHYQYQYHYHKSIIFIFIHHRYEKYTHDEMETDLPTD